ncbi:nitroreductase family protein [Paenibacillus methanolicus]|uniref:Nitroreductase n=1 Tax=Paenibacillus methanolicus TaxID=582686 RepID=A0A5S5C946_9BACL|nr:nitroreductase family protein [Paenibacillus methanolicus]TYP74906.1 nitroreductase [Paenibacillus methanolicus]
MTERTQEAVSYLNVIESRRSVRAYDPSFRLERSELEALIQEATLAPSSANLQPWRFLIIDDPQLQEVVFPIANSQEQVRTASAVIAILGDLQCYEHLEEIYGEAVARGYMTQEIKESFVARVSAMLPAMSEQQRKEMAMFDGGLATMQLMLSARAKGLDTVPMAGFDKDKFKEAFAIPDRFAPLLLVAVGKAEKEGHPTTRLPVERVTFWNDHFNA